ncbi:F-actin-capping protein [Chytridiales sp. JEL 0842]|nr:F-actin-capping protein [Chytridiales sp. JEL 0842]
MDHDEKVAIIRDFLLDAPPGEVNDVFNDIRVLIQDDELLEQAVAEPFEEYNTDNFHVVSLPDQQHQTLLTKYGYLGDNRFVDPKSKQSFTFDHVKQLISDVQTHETTSDFEPFREATQSAVEKYIADHYPDGASSTFVASDGRLSICMVNNKYNPANFWQVPPLFSKNGRWRSYWTVKVGEADITGFIKTNVHYYEDGNVQLNNTKEFSASVFSAYSVSQKIKSLVRQEPEEFASAIVKTVIKLEGEYQIALNEGFVHLAGSIFKSLRRALPVTRTKMEWDAISNYKIGSELSKK